MLTHVFSKCCASPMTCGVAARPSRLVLTSSPTCTKAFDDGLSVLVSFLDNTSSLLCKTRRCKDGMNTLSEKRV